MQRAAKLSKSANGPVTSRVAGTPFGQDTTGWVNHPLVI